MSNTEYTYDAFISYRHAELDKFVAENLHKQLESFHLPLNVSRKKAKGTKTRIKRIFRDKDELPIASDLATPIMSALQNSEFLIVICSPRAPQSQWVEREIDTFISMHGRANILAVLIEGEPADSFPPALLTDEKEVTLADGTTTVVKVPVEPLAADVRGKDKREVLKNIKAETLRLAAPMFHCGYDDLKQRHRERKIKRTLRILAAISIFFVLFGSFSTFQALRIQKQSEQIELQSEEIKTQYHDILVASLNQEADNSLRLLEDGDRINSIQTALNALPKDSSDATTPYIPHAEYALSQALYTYQNNSSLLADRILQHDTTVDYMKTSPSGKYILTHDETNTIHIWEAATGNEISTLYENDTFKFTTSEYAVTFFNDSEILYAGWDNVLRRYDFISNTMVWETSKDQLPSINNIVYSMDLQYAAVTTYESIYIIDTSSGEILSSYIPEIELSSEDDDMGQVMAFSPDLSLLAFTSRNTLNEEYGEVKLMSIANGEIITTIQTEKPYINSLILWDNNLGIAASTYLNTHDMTINDFYGKNQNTDFSLYNTDSLQKKWQITIDGEIIYNSHFLSRDKEYLILESYSTIYTIDPHDGSISDTIPQDSQITNCIFKEDSTFSTIITRNGNINSLDFQNGYFYPSIFSINSTNIKSAIRGEGFFAFLPYSSRQITLYSNPNMEYIKPFINFENFTSCITLNPSCNKMAGVIYSTSSYTLFSLEYPSGKEYFKQEFKSPISYICYAGSDNNQICVCTIDGAQFFDSTSGEKITEVLWPGYSSIHQYKLDSENHLLYCLRSDSYIVLDLNTGEIAAEVNAPDTMEYPSCQAITMANDTIWMVNNNTHSLEQYDESFSTCLLKKEINSNYVSTIFSDDSGSLLFVTYKNAAVEIYNTTALSLITTYEDLPFIPKSYIGLENGSNDYLLTNDSSACQFTASNELKAYMPYFKNIDTKNNTIISYDYYDLTLTPLFSLDMLREEAKQQLKGSTR